MIYSRAKCTIFCSSEKQRAGKKIETNDIKIEQTYLVKSQFNIKMSYFYINMASFTFLPFLICEMTILPFSRTYTATLRELILNAGADDDSGGFAIAKRNKGGAGDVEVVAAGDEGADLPLNAAVNLNGHFDAAVSLVLGEGEAVVGGDGDVVAVDKRGPDVDVFVALVDGVDDGVVGDLLVVVGAVDVELVVVDADLGVGVAGVDGDLDGGGDDVGGGDV